MKELNQCRIYMQETFEFKQGKSLIVPNGFTGYWHMPEKYRELIIINTDYS